LDLSASRWILFTVIIVDARNHEPEKMNLKQRVDVH
jgi:hypothetical protein